VLLFAEDLAYDAPGDTGPLRVLDGLDLALDAGELVDVGGPSGVGKTTLLRALARLLPGARGTLVFAGAPARDVLPAEWRRHITLLPQKAVMRPGTVRDNLLLPWRLRVRAEERPLHDGDLRRALDDVGLADVALDRDAAKLSVGQTARVSLLRVMLATPDILLLDEPDANLDDASAEQVRAMTERFVAQGGAAVRVRHLRSDDLATRRYRLVAGRLEEVL
jgi:putative ABC transport system ATP-binding protein